MLNRDERGRWIHRRCAFARLQYHPWKSRICSVHYEGGKDNLSRSRTSTDGGLESTIPRHQRSTNLVRPGEVFNRLPDVADGLLAAFLSEGWQKVSQDSEKYQLRRPGKSDGNSCTLYRSGAVKNFSTSTNLDTDRAMTPFYTLAQLKYSEDERRCAADLAVDLGMKKKPASKTRNEAVTVDARESLKNALPKKEAKALLPAPVRFSSINAEALTPKPVLIKGCLYQGGKMMIAAPSKARKSWMLMDLCGAVANGADWMGLETLKLCSS